MKIHFSRMERVAGFFVLGTLVLAVVVLITLAIKKNWLESKVHFHTYLDQGDGMRSGSSVEMAGVKVGAVDDIELDPTKRIRITFYLNGTFYSKLKTGWRIKVIRPFVLGDKVLEVVPDLSEPARVGGDVQSEEMFSLIDLLNGRKIGPYAETFSVALQSLKQVLDMILTKNSPKELVKLIESVQPLLFNLSQMSFEMTKFTHQMNSGNNVKVVMQNLVGTTEQLNRLLPQLAQTSPELKKDLVTVVGNLAVLTEEFKKVLPAISEVAPDLPRSSRRMIQALDEAVVVLKAMQKSFLLRGSSREVREEESRMPAGLPEAAPIPGDKTPQ